MVAYRVAYRFARLLTLLMDRCPALSVGGALSVGDALSVGVALPWRRSWIDVGPWVLVFPFGFQLLDRDFFITVVRMCCVLIRLSLSALI